ncbi:STE20like serine/threonineprotein kinaselike [Caligus rogercresseyi]|uniref:STE20like serine/threonineprotein kinaselike n=1 Tax=Caligus rogercresseyi TaxID=217165 RepID=A0A7T8GZT1_CALRO|nr:STE20like serine/threonineprotein kinaselike [Caligus rogercresseyi]
MKLCDFFLFLSQEEEKSVCGASLFVKVFQVPFSSVDLDHPLLSVLDLLFLLDFGSLSWIHLKRVLHLGSDPGGKGPKSRVTPNVKTGFNPESEWEIVGDLGDGAFGKVHKARHRVSGRLAAAKVCKLTHEEDLEDFSVEIDILSEMEHDNVISLYEAYFYEDQLWVRPIRLTRAKSQKQRNEAKSGAQSLDDS